MKLNKQVSILTIVLGFLSIYTIAGNKEKLGQAGSTEILINPWAKSSGWGGTNTASVRGLESANLNIAGMAFTDKTEIGFSSSQYIKEFDININAFGFAQKVGASSVIGLAITSMSFGNIERTTSQQPEGGLGTYNYVSNNVALCYSKEFSNSIYAGILARSISSGISNVKAQGFALDAGIHYVAGEMEQIKFGIAIRNVGTKMVYRGEGMSTLATLSNGRSGTVDSRSSAYEIPSLLNIGASYDLYFMENHRLTGVGNFTSNSFSRDVIGVGLEYGFMNYLALRLGYNYIDGNWDYSTFVNAFTGQNFGFTVQVPLGENGSTLGVDYAYQPSIVFQGSHLIGARINIK